VLQPKRLQSWQKPPTSGGESNKWSSEPFVWANLRAPEEQRNMSLKICNVLLHQTSPQKLRGFCWKCGWSNQDSPSWDTSQKIGIWHFCHS
jgi:hypothetical protein